MIDFSTFFSHLEKYKLEKYTSTFAHAIEDGISPQKQGDVHALLKVLTKSPHITDVEIDIKHGVTIGRENDLNNAQKSALRECLALLIPWRKGPFTLFGIDIDTEWRSDWKWERVKPHLSPLHRRKVLDVGCGSGYHCWRMAGEGAEWVVGIDPSPRFVAQFQLIHQYVPQVPIDLLPIGIEHLPPRMNTFDTVFSMGVFYHRSAPMDHLKALRDAMKPGGELVLETLVIEGDTHNVLVPEGRYAQMRNVWFLPSVPALITWLSKCGFENARCVDVNQTSSEEQRRTEWMSSHSLDDFLDPKDKNRTIEGYPAPLRAVIIANRPLPKNSKNL